jgi:hypothetical protein
LIGVVVSALASSPAGHAPGKLGHHARGKWDPAKGEAECQTRDHCKAERANQHPAHGTRSSSLAGFGGCEFGRPILGVALRSLALATSAPSSRLNFRFC